MFPKMLFLMEMYVLLRSSGVSVSVISTGTVHIFSDKNTLTSEFYEELHAFIGPQLTNIASDIAENLTKDTLSGGGNNKSLLCSSSSSSSSSLVTAATSAGSASATTVTMGNANTSDESSPAIKYLFFNELNFQHNGTVHFNQKLYKKKRSIPRDIMNLLNDLYMQDANCSNSCEVIVKTLSDYWIVKRTTNWRHSFVIFNKNATLLDIAEEANKIFDAHLNDVFSHV